VSYCRSEVSVISHRDTSFSAFEVCFSIGELLKDACSLKVQPLHVTKSFNVSITALPRCVIKCSASRNESNSCCKVSEEPEEMKAYSSAGFLVECWEDVLHACESSYRSEVKNECGVEKTILLLPLAASTFQNTVS
jgi:hypothetical protein